VQALEAALAQLRGLPAPTEANSPGVPDLKGAEMDDADDADNAPGPLAPQVRGR
jgi:hypothetical protein